MSGLETNLKSTRPRPGHYETKTETTSKRPRPRPRPVSKPSSLPSTYGTGNGTKKVLRYFSTRYCPPLLVK